MNNDFHGLHLIRQLLNDFSINLLNLDIRGGVRKITPEENCPPVMVRVWFRISVRIRAGGQFSLGAIFLEPLEGG